MIRVHKNPFALWLVVLGNPAWCPQQFFSWACCDKIARTNWNVINSKQFGFRVNNQGIVSFALVFASGGIGNDAKIFWGCLEGSWSSTMWSLSCPCFRTSKQTLHNLSCVISDCWKMWLLVWANVHPMWQMGLVSCLVSVGCQEVSLCSICSMIKSGAQWSLCLANCFSTTESSVGSSSLVFNQHLLNKAHSNSWERECHRVKH